MHVAINKPLFYTRFGVFLEGRPLRLWIPTVAFGVVLLLAARIVKKPLTVPVTIGVGLVVFALVALAMGESIADIRSGGWLLGPLTRDVAWKTWTFQAITDADWLAVARSWVPIVVAVIVAPLVLLHSLGEARSSSMAIWTPTRRSATPVC